MDLTTPNPVSSSNLPFHQRFLLISTSHGHLTPHQNSWLLSQPALDTPPSLKLICSSYFPLRQQSYIQGKFLRSENIPIISFGFQ